MICYNITNYTIFFLKGQRGTVYFREDFYMKSFGEKLAFVRRQHGISQEELGDMLGVSRHIVSKWETDRGKPSVDNLAVICDFFHISANYFWEESYPDEAVFAEEASALSEAKAPNACPAASEFETSFSALHDQIRNLEQRLSRISYLQQCIAVFALALFNIILGGIMLGSAMVTFVMGTSLFPFNINAAQVVYSTPMSVPGFVILLLLSLALLAAEIWLLPIACRLNKQRLEAKEQIGLQATEQPEINIMED